MPVVGKLKWGFKPDAKGPLYHPLLAKLDQHVKACNQLGVDTQWQREVFRNTENNLPQKKAYAYYWEFTLAESSENRGTYRMVLGDGGEVYVTWDHYDNFLQIEAVPGAIPVMRPHANTYFTLGVTEERRGNHKAARNYFQASLDFYHQQNDTRQIARVIWAIGRMTERMKTKAGQFKHNDEVAVRIYAAVGTMLSAPLTTPNFQARLGITLTPQDLQALNNLQLKYPRAWAEGQQWSLDKAIKFALSV